MQGFPSRDSAAVINYSAQTSDSANQPDETGEQSLDLETGHDPIDAKTGPELSELRSSSSLELCANNFLLDWCWA